MSDEPSSPPLPPPEYEDAAIRQAVKAFRPYSGPPRWLKVLGLLLILAAGCGMLLSQLEWTKGRPLRGRRRRKGKRGPVEPQDPIARATAHWVAMAAEEYESVATFTELADDLEAVGAPAALVTRCHHAAREEARHTDACLAVAETLCGSRVPKPEVPWARQTRRRPRWRTTRLVRLAVESYVDGCIGEASSAWVLARVRKTTRSAAIRRALDTLAREEMGHARLGQDIVHWCCEEGGAPVRHAVAATASRVARMRPPRGASGEGLAAFGVPDDALRARGFGWSRGRAAAST